MVTLTKDRETFKNKKVFIPVIDQIIKQYIITPFVGFSKLIIFKISSSYSFFYCENLSLHLIPLTYDLRAFHRKSNQRAIYLWINTNFSVPTLYKLTIRQQSPTDLWWFLWWGLGYKFGHYRFLFIGGLHVMCQLHELFLFFVGTWPFLLWKLVLIRRIRITHVCKVLQIQMQIQILKCKTTYKLNWALLYYMYIWYILYIQYNGIYMWNIGIWFENSLIYFAYIPYRWFIGMCR